MRAGIIASTVTAVLAISVLGTPAAIAAPKAAVTTKTAATEVSTQRRVRNALRIEVTPSRRLYRQCIDWYAVERRPSGPVVTPHMRCRWAYR